MTGPDETITVPVVLPAREAERLSVLIDPDQGLPDLAAVIGKILDHVQQGVYRPGAWERGEVVCSMFGDEWLGRMEPDDDPGRLSADGRVIFDRPRLDGTADERGEDAGH